MPIRKPAPGDLEAIETASRDELQALQLQRLKWTLRHAYDNVAHYRAAFDAAGVRPDDLRTLDDLAKFPFTVKADLSIDAVPTSVEIDRTLAKLENLAKERGTAVGIASALPISIERIGIWIKALETHGIMLVPLTTAMLKSKSG